MSKSQHPIDQATVEMPKLLRLFTLLPIKQGFGCSYFKVDNSAFLSLLKRSGIKNLRTASQWTDKVRTEYWCRFFNVAKFETATRKFGGEIMTAEQQVAVC